MTEVELRDAATVLILRDGEPDADGNALEVFMLRRNLNSDFVGGAYVFPGGAVDPEDRFADLEAVCEGRTDADASARLGVEHGGLAFWVAAIRESFEEAGVLLAYHEDGEVIRLDDPATAERFVTHRTAVDTKARRLVEICDEEHLRLAVDTIWYFGHWITPVGAPRRYDTRFFVTGAPPAQTPLHDDHEVIANLWVRPAEALARHGNGDYEMLPPTIASVRAVARFATAGEALAAATEITDVPTILPRVIVDDERRAHRAARRSRVRRRLHRHRPARPLAHGGGTQPQRPAGAGRRRAGLTTRSRHGRCGRVPRRGRRASLTIRPVPGHRPAGRPMSHPSPSDLAEPPVNVPKPIVPEVASALSPMVRRITAANPGMMTGPGTNTYLVGIDEIAVIDPGPADEAHLDAVAGCGGDRIKWILCTHTHPDHSPGAAGLKARTGAEVLAFDSRDGLVVDRRLADGDTVDGTEFTLRAIHTPGHASNHLCYLLEGERLLFTGDHVMQGSTVVISPPDGDMAVYLDSLRKVAALRRLKAIAPGHGLLITDPAVVIADYIAHRLDREQQVLGALQAGPRTPAEIVEALYADVADELHEVAAKSVWAHLRKLAAEGQATSTTPTPSNPPGPPA